MRMKVLGKRMQRRPRVMKKTMLSRNTTVTRWRKPSRESRSRDSLGGVDFAESMVKEARVGNQEFVLQIDE
jgi:hypothetical protein